MDSHCDYLLYGKRDNGSVQDDTGCESCLHCSDYPIQENPIRCSATHRTPKVPFEQAMTGRMVPYVAVLEVLEESTQAKCELFEESETLCKR